MRVDILPGVAGAREASIAEEGLVCCAEVELAPQRGGERRSEKSGGPLLLLRPLFQHAS